MQDERDALSRGHRFEHHEEGHVDRLIEGHSVGRIKVCAAPSADPLPTIGQRLREPFTHVALPPDPGRAEQIQADATGDPHQPAAGGFDGLPPLWGHCVPAGIRLLADILRISQ